jgi:two-component sensor histidine kinase
LASHAGRCFQTGLTVTVEDLEDGMFRIDPSLEAHGIRSLVDVPIQVEGASWGVLEADSTILRKFSEDTVEFLVAAAALTGLMVLRTRAERGHEEALAEQSREVQRRKLLLSEMQHRVKNYFHMILAMIDLQGRNLVAQGTREAMMKLADNVMAMALAHNQLSASQEQEKINLGSYLTALTSTIEKPIEGLTLEIQANEMEVGVDQAIPLGLIVNEAVTNAVKHAFAGGPGAIRVELINQGHGEALLSICDNGKGIPAEPVHGSGTKLMDALARQVRGKVERVQNDGGGTIVRVVFPRPLTPSPA